MAIPTFVSAGTVAASTGDTATPGAPGSSISGDVWLLHTSGKEGAVHPTNLHQWVPIIQRMEPNQDLLVMAVWAHVYDGVTAPNLEITDGGNATTVLMGKCSAWRGCGIPAWHRITASDDDTNDTNVSCGSVTTADADCLILAFVTVSDSYTIGSWANSNLASPGITEAYDELTTLSTDMHISCAYGGLATAGASGATTATLSASNNSKVFATIALTPTSDTTHPYLTGVDFDDQENTTITLTALEDAEDDDIWLLFLNARNNASPPAPPTGGDWTQIGTLEEGADSDSAAYYHRYDTSAPNLVIPNPITNHSAILMGFRQCVNTGSPVDASDGSTTGSGSTFSILGVTPTEDNCAIAWVVFNQHDDAWLGNFANATIGIHGGVAGRASKDEREGYGLTYSIKDTGGTYSGATTGIVDGNVATIHWAIALEPAVAATHYTENVDSGSYAVTGSTVSVAVSSEASSGSYTATGSLATLLADYETDASAGAYTTTGSAATLTVGYQLDADAGSYAATGSVATADIGCTASSGVYAVTGSTATVTVGYQLDTDAGSYAVAGSAATLITDYQQAADTGSYSVNGSTAALVSGLYLDAATGSYTVTGSVADPQSDYIQDVDTGSYAVVGSDAAVVSGLYLDADTGSYSVAGAESSLLSDYVQDAATGTYGVTGSAATFLSQLVAASGSYSVAGTDMTAAMSSTVDVGTYAVTGALLDGLIYSTVATGSYNTAGASAFGELVSIAVAGEYQITGSEVVNSETSVTCWKCRHRTTFTGATSNCYRCQSRISA